MNNRKSQAWISIFTEIHEFMETHLNKWGTIEEIRNTYDRFVLNLKKIGDLQPELEKDFTPIREELNVRRENLLERLVPAGNIFEVYTQDHEAGKKAGTLASDWRRADSLGRHRLLDLSTGILNFMVKHLSHEETGNPEPPAVDQPPDADLRKYGINLTILDGVQASLGEYQSTLKLLDDALGYRKKIRKKRDGLIRKNRKLLRNRLDKLMTVFSGTHPSFYLEYHTLSTKKPGD